MNYFLLLYVVYVLLIFIVVWLMKRKESAGTIGTLLASSDFPTLLHSLVKDVEYVDMLPNNSLNDLRLNKENVGEIHQALKSWPLIAYFNMTAPQSLTDKGRMYVLPEQGYVAYFSQGGGGSSLISFLVTPEFVSDISSRIRDFVPSYPFSIVEPFGFRTEIRQETDLKKLEDAVLKYITSPASVPQEFQLYEVVDHGGQSRAMMTVLKQEQNNAAQIDYRVGASTYLL
jgi:hypothetical protein